MAGLPKTVSGALGNKLVIAGAGLAAAQMLAINSAQNKSNVSAFGTSLYFPGDLGSQKHPHYISFGFQQYKRRALQNSDPFLTDSGMIRLPIPNGLVDSQEVSFEQDDTPIAVGAVLEQQLQGNGAASDKINAMMNAAGGVLQGTTAAALPAQALQLAGLAQNPFLTVLFKAPRFKRHSFQWRLAPNNAQESQILANICNKFKYHQLPDISDGTATLLTYPDMVSVQLYPDDTYLYKFKPCVIESFTVNYTPEGQPTFFSSVDAPGIIQIHMNLLEIEYWIKKDVLAAQGLSAS